MTSEDKEHIENVARIKAEWDSAKESMEKKKKALGLVATDASQFPEHFRSETPEPSEELTFEAVDELATLEQRVKRLQKEFNDATGS